MLHVVWPSNKENQHDLQQMKIIDRYQLEEVVGSGTYGKVYRSTATGTGDVFAVKCIPIEKFRKIRKLHEFTKNEIYVLEKIDHPNIVKYYEKLTTVNNTYMVYEYCADGTLEKKIYENKFLQEEPALRYFSQMLSALCLLDQHHILHRDLKPQNIMLHHDMIKLGDFGFCKPRKHYTDFTQTMVGSPIYMSPEILNNQSYDSKADVWSLGVCLYEMLYGMCPYEASSIPQLMMMQKKEQPKFDLKVNNISENTQKLIRMFLVLNPRERTTFANAQDFLSSYFPFSKELQLKYNTKQIVIPKDVNFNVVVEKSKYNFENIEKEPKIQEITIPPTQMPIQYVQVQQQRSPHQFVQRANTNEGFNNQYEKFVTPRGDFNPNFFNTGQMNKNTPQRVSDPHVQPPQQFFNKQTHQQYQQIRPPPQIYQNEPSNLPYILVGLEGIQDKSYFCQELIKLHKTIQHQKSQNLTEIDLIFQKRTKYQILLMFIKKMWNFQTQALEKKFIAILMLFKRVNNLMLEIKIQLSGMSSHTLNKYLIEPETFKNTITKEIEDFNNFYNQISIQMMKFVQNKPEYSEAKSEINNYDFNLEKFKKNLIALAVYMKQTEENQNYQQHEQNLGVILDSLMVDELYDAFGQLNDMIELNRYQDLVDKMTLSEITAFNQNKFKLATAIAQ